MDKSFRLPIHSGLAGGERESCAARRELSVFRTGMEHQRRVFMDQLRVAVEMGRGVSVHSVQCHGVVYECLRQLGEESHCKVSKKEQKRRNVRGKKSLEEGNDGVGNATIEGKEGDNNNNNNHNNNHINHNADNTAGAATENNNDNTPNTPRICIHSASLSPSTLSQYLSQSLPLHVYFSFSLVINARYGAKLLDLIRAVPDDRILIESDFHSEGEQRRMLLEGIARVVLGVKRWGVEQGVGILERNWERFVYGERAEGGGG
jgi:Tat protein secretion system quality control protein TatD with DNase activity